MAGGVKELVGHWTRSKTWVNIGTAYVDVYVGTGEVGLPVTLDTTGWTYTRLRAQWNKIGAGTQSLRVVRVSDSLELVAIANLVTGDNDSGQVAIPAALKNASFTCKLQAKSTTGADDPVFNAAALHVEG